VDEDSSGIIGDSFCSFDQLPSSISTKQKELYQPKLCESSSDLPAGTAGTARVHPRRTAGRAGTGRRIFFSKPYPTRLISVPVAGTRVPRVQVRRYSGTRGGPKVGRVHGYSTTREREPL
jgi:hypothetical protein